MKAPVVGYRTWVISAPKLEVEIPSADRRTRAGRLGDTPYVEGSEVDDWLASQIVQALKVKRHQPTLRPLSGGSFWRRRQDIYTMECQEGHTSPVRACTCGLYAWAEPSALRHDGRGVLAAGAILAWGHLIVHGDDFGVEGFRAQHHRIIAFAATARSGRQKVLQEAVAVRYKVPLVAPASLRMVALEHGVSLAEAVGG